MAEELVLFSKVGPDILGLVHQHLQEWEEFQQLLVVRVHEPRLDRDAILQLVAEGLKVNRTIRQGKGFQHFLTTFLCFLWLLPRASKMLQTITVIHGSARRFSQSLSKW